MSLTPLTETLIIAGTLAAVIASIIAIYMVMLSLRVYRLTLTAYTSIRDVLTQFTIQVEGPMKEASTPQQAQPQAQEQETAVVKTPKEPYDTLAGLVEGEGLKAAMLFDESGYVVDYVGDIDAGKEAALLAEVVGSLSLARESARGIIFSDGDTEILTRVAELGGKNIFLYARAAKSAEIPSIDFLNQSASKAIKTMIGGG
jgi:hypothetical protein